jgi:hypothetical protein
MRADDANRLPLDQILKHEGHTFVKSRKDGRELWYTSPFRKEKTPSLHISLVHNNRLGCIWVWKDFGDIGGNVIAFAMRYYGIPDVPGVLKKLDELGIKPMGAGVSSPAPMMALLEPKPADAAHPFTDVRIQPLASPDLLEYLGGRGINAALAERYLQEVHYRFEGKPFSALAFRNDKGGYEMRSTGWFKGALPPKTMTFLHPEKLPSSAAIAVFEGIIDYLSALTYYGKMEAETPVLILNSVVTEKAATQKIQSLGVRKVHLYLDRDEVGKKLVERFRELLSGMEVMDQSRLYVGHKDFNAFLVARQKANCREIAR